MVRQANIVVVASPNPEYDPRRHGLKDLPDGANLLAVGTLEEVLGNPKIAEANVLLNSFQGLLTYEDVSRLWPYLPKVEWIAVLSAGLNRILAKEVIESDVLLTNGKGNFGHVLAEWAIAGFLYFAKNIQELQENQAKSQWQSIFVEELRGRTLGVIGYGDIGQRTAKLAKVFGMKIVALRRRTELSNEELKDGLEVYPPEELNKVISISDYIVNALPFTPATHKFISREALAYLKPNAVFVNVGRGTTVDEDALIEALQEKRLKGAALDVTYKEPLPETSPLWKLDNVLISPHSAPRTTTILHDALKGFLHNVKLFTEGKDLINIVDKIHGY